MLNITIYSNNILLLYQADPVLSVPGIVFDPRRGDLGEVAIEFLLQCLVVGQHITFAFLNEAFFGQVWEAPRTKCAVDGDIR